MVTLNESDTTGVKNISAGSVPIVGGSPQLWCRVRNSALPPVGSVVFSWYKDQPSAFILQYTVGRLSGDFTDGYLKDSDFRTAGAKFRCDVAVNGQQIGSAHFTITP